MVGPRWWALGGLALAAGACKGRSEAPDPVHSEEIAPGRVVLRRLNRTEYARTVRDLLGTEPTWTGAFPADERVAGFDNMAAALSTSELHVEAWLAAAEGLAVEALGLERAVVDRVPAISPRLAAEGGEVADGVLHVDPGGSSAVGWHVAEAGAHRVAMRGWVDEPGPVELIVNDELHLVELSATDEARRGILWVDVDLAAGPVDVEIGWDGELARLHVEWVQLTGPLDAPSPHLVACDPHAAGDLREGERDCAREILHPLADRAWRRPLDAVAQQALDGLIARLLAAEPYEDALRYGITSILVSPRFLFRPEPLPDPGSPEPQPLDGPALASRLSYFLWSSMPDAALREAADAGALETEEGIADQVRRMLRDPRADALVVDFADQWLHARGVAELSHLDPPLRASLREETHRFFASFLEQPRALEALLTASEGAIDDRLAAHYGVEASGGWSVVDLAAAGRGGVLGHAGVLAVLSHVDRTSPVRRGQFVLRQLLCSEPPPPPPGVEGLSIALDGPGVREQLAQHRTDPACASCHQVMDELGFALEHFGPDGTFRMHDPWGPVDATGTLPDGTTLAGAREMAAWVAADPRFPACVTQQLLSWALGRPVTEADGPAVAAITERFLAEGGHLEALAVAIATSPPFRRASGDPGGAP